MTVLAFLCVLGASQALLFGAALFCAKNNRVANRLLGAFAWVAAIFISAAVMTSSGVYVRFPHLSFVSDPFFFCALPLLFLYVRSILSEGSLRLKDVWHCGPAIAVALYLLPWYLQSDEAKRSGLLGLTQSSFPPWFYVKSFALLIQGVAYISASVWIVYRHGRTIERPLRAARAYVFRNARFAIGVLSVFWIVGVLRVLEFFGYAKRFNLQENLIFPFMVSMIVYLICYSALKHPEAVYGSPGPTKKYERSGLSTLAMEAGVNKLASYMESNKPYLDGDLTLQLLSSKVGLLPNHLSRIINERWKMGFQEFLNSYRVKAAESMLLDPAVGHYSILAIAHDVGFNSKSAFNAAFQRHRGTTPTEYRNEAAKFRNPQR